MGSHVASSDRWELSVQSSAVCLVSAATTSYNIVSTGRTVQYVSCIGHNARQRHFVVVGVAQVYILGQLEKIATTMAVESNSHETPNDSSWFLSFAAVMFPFTAFVYGHSKGVTARVVNAVVRSPLGAPGLLLLPFGTLAMEKSIYDTVQAAQGINPNTRPADRGGFPSGGATLPSFSLIPVQHHHRRVQQPAAADSTAASLLRRLTTAAVAADPKEQAEMTR